VRVAEEAERSVFAIMTLERRIALKKRRLLAIMSATTFCPRFPRFNQAKSNIRNEIKNLHRALWIKGTADADRTDRDSFR